MRPFHILRTSAVVILTALAVTGTVVASGVSAQAAVLGDRLGSGSVLAPGDSLESPSGTYQLLMQADGTLVDSGPDGQVVWQTSTGTPGASLLNAADGNLVIQAPDGSVVWSTGYDPSRGAATLSIRDDGNLIDQSDSGSTLWVIYTTGGPLTPADGAAEFAREQLGKPYQFGGTGPGTYDNSGLTLAAYAVVGVALPHSATGQLAAGTPVDAGDMQAGDLVFYSSGTLVAMYIGNDKVVVATHAGTVVHVANVDFSPVYAIARVG